MPAMPAPCCDPPDSQPLIRAFPFQAGKTLPALLANVNCLSGGVPWAIRGGKKAVLF